MPWIAENRRDALVKAGEPLLTEALKAHLREKYLPRFPTKRAATLPALHLIQHTYNWIPTQAMQELAEFLEIAPAEVMDTATFYEEYWLRPKGKYLLQFCRSISCELCQSDELVKRVQQTLQIDVGETTLDKKFTLVEVECLGACGTAPVALINEVLLENLTVDSLDAALKALPEDPHDYKDPTITWAETH